MTLKNGATKTGFITKRDASGLTLKMPGGSTETIPVPEIAQTTNAPNTISTMPEGLLDSLTLQEAADLLEYIQTLK